MKKVGIIIASVREQRIGDSIAKHVLKLAQTSKALEYSLIDLKEINLPMLNEPYPAAAKNYQYPHTKAWSETISACDGFIIVTAEYNHGYPPAIKNALDYLYTEWNNKPLAFVGYGYSNGVRAIEQLRQVVSYLQLKPLWKDVGISLITNAKDGMFFTTEMVDNQLNGLIKDLESNLVVKM
ncbi:MAG: NADPH-dependent reductase [Burkholderiales bacterium]|jgi:NAD(P)H-dependent FMN reductase|nr:NADPH-dependent reductase [Burkholderiales bacterium]